MESRNPESDSILNAFLRRLLEDRALGRESTLEEYLLDYPGHESLLRAEYLRIAQEEEPAPETSSEAQLRAFRTAHEADRRRGESAPLEEYLERFPGAGLAIAKEYAGFVSAALSSTELDFTQAGGRVGPYRLIDELGRGGQGTVFLAEDTRLGRKVALKILTGMGAASRERMQRLRREATITGNLDHPGICPVYEWDLADGAPFVAMRYLEGRTLAEHITAARTASDEKLAVDRILRWIESAAHALHAAHEEGVVHRDVKPSNLMVLPTNEIVVLDFGLATVLESEEPTLTGSGDMLGTPAYMSPEQIEGKSLRGAPDRRTDVYSLGVCLYEALALQRPFTASNRTELLRKILVGARGDGRELGQRISGDLRTVVATAMAREPGDRYATAADLAADLKRCRELCPIAARPAGPWKRLRRWARREPILATITACSVVLLGALAWGLGYWRSQAPVLRAGTASLQEHVLNTRMEEHLKGTGALSEDFIAEYPENVLIRVIIATSYLAEREPLNALGALDLHKPTGEEPNALRRVRAAAHDMLGQAEESDLLREGLAPPTRPVDHFAQGYLLMVTLNKGEAAPLAKPALERAVLLAEKPQMPYHNTLFEAAYHSGDYELAETVVQAIEELWPDYGVSQVNIATMHLQRRDWARAQAAYERAIELMPQSAHAHAGLSLLLFEAGEIERGKHHSNEAIALSQQFPGAVQSLYESQGRLLAKHGLFDDAMQAFDRALAIDPDDASTHAAMAGALFAMGEIDWAREELALALTLAPEEAAFLKELAGFDALPEEP